MFSNSTKSTTVKAGQPAAFRRVRNAAADRGLAATRGLPADTRAHSQAVQPPVPADRLGTALTLLLSLALRSRRLAGGRANLGESGYDPLRIARSVRLPRAKDRGATAHSRLGIAGQVGQVRKAERGRPGSAKSDSLDMTTTAAP